MVTSSILNHTISSDNAANPEMKYWHAHSKNDLSQTNGVDGSAAELSAESSFFSLAYIVNANTAQKKLIATPK